MDIWGKLTNELNWLFRVHVMVCLGHLWENQNVDWQVQCWMELHLQDQGLPLCGLNSEVHKGKKNKKKKEEIQNES